MDDGAHGFARGDEPEFRAVELDPTPEEVKLGIVAVHEVRHKIVSMVIVETCDGRFSSGINVNRDHTLSQCLARRWAVRHLSQVPNPRKWRTTYTHTQGANQ